MLGGTGGGVDPQCFPLAPGSGGLYHRGGTIRPGGGDFDGRQLPPSTWANAPRMHTGGPVLRPGEVPIIAQTGEVVVPRSMVSKTNRSGATVSNTNVHNNGAISIDMSKTGAVGADDESNKQFGLDLQRLIRTEMVRESRPGGLLRRGA